MLEPLVITGAGIVSPFGVGLSSWREALRQPQSSTAAVLEQTKHGKAALLHDFDPREYLGPRGLRNLDRLTTFLIIAAQEAQSEAQLPGDIDPERIGLCLATAYGSLDSITELNRIAELEDPRYVSPSRFPNTVINSAAGYVSIWEDLRGPNTTLVNGNCGAIDALVLARNHMRHRRSDIFLVGGGEVVSESMQLAVEKLGLLSGSSAARFFLGEGAVLVCVESLEHAQKRGVAPLASLRGLASTFEAPAQAHSLVNVSPDAVSRAARACLTQAGLDPQAIDLVCMSGNGIERIDQPEAEGLAQVFGEGRECHPLMLRPKRLHGETFGASGALSMACVLEWFAGLPINDLGQQDALQALPSRPRFALISSVGFYGNVSMTLLENLQPHA